MSTVQGQDNPPSESEIGTPAAVTAPPAAPLDLVEATTTSRQRMFRRLSGSSAVYMGLVLVAVLVIFSVARPDAFPSEANAKNIVTDASMLLVLGTGLTFVMVAAGIDLSIGSVLVFAGVMGAKTMSGLGGQGVWATLVGCVVAIVSGAAWGLFNGWCITRLRVPALITTLGSLGAALGLANVITNGNDVQSVPDDLTAFTTHSFLGLAWIVWIPIVVVVIGGLILQFTRFGRHTYIIGSNSEAARRAGINVDAHLLKLYTIMGALTGLAGLLSLSRYATTTIGSHTNDALEVITGVILGGTSLFGGIGTVIGTIIGIFIPAALNNGFVVMNVQPFWQQVAIGFVLIAAVYLDQLKRRQRDRA